MNMRPSRTFIISTVFLLALLIGLHRHAAIRETRSFLANGKIQLGRQRERSATLKKEIDQLALEIRGETAARSAAQARAASQFAELAKVDPSAAWAEPPPYLPNWEEPSPFVWVSKDTLQKLPLPAFNRDGALDGSLASILMLDTATHQAVNHKLRSLVTSFHQLEADRATPSTNHLPGIENGEKITILVPPLEDQERTKFERDFRGTLLESLGDQRSEITLKLGERWLADKISQFGKGEKRISVVRHPNGDYNLSIQTPGSWISFGGRIDLPSEIPAHLLHHFAELLPEKEGQTQ